MKIGLFGGSFNPIHKGHLKIASDAIKILNLDKLIFIPCQQNPFKKKEDYVDGYLRVEMIKELLFDKTEVSTFEIDRRGPSYTIDTIKYFKNKYKNDELFFIMGSDNLTKLSKWKNINEIHKLIKLVIFKRTQNINKTYVKKYNALLMNNIVYPESSSDFLKGDFFVVEQKTLNFIGRNFIYFDSILKKTLPQKRYLHCKHTKNFAIKLAEKHNYNIEKAGFAGFVHDIAKYVDKETAFQLIKSFEPNSINIENYKLHQEVGYIILKHIFNIDEDICLAVRKHTSLDLKLSILDKIVYLSDKLCQGRKYKGIQNDRKLALINIDQALKNVINRNIIFNKEKGIVFSKEQQNIYNKWTK